MAEALFASSGREMPEARPPSALLRGSGSSSLDGSLSRRGGQRQERAFLLATFASPRDPASGARHEPYEREKAEGRRHEQALMRLAPRRAHVLVATLAFFQSHAIPQTA